MTNNNFAELVGCRVKAKCPHVGPGYTGGMPSVGGGSFAERLFLKYIYIYIRIHTNYNIIINNKYKNNYF